MARKRRALFVSSAIGLGHVQRDLAIAREMRALQPDLEIDWFTVDPAPTLPASARASACTRSPRGWPTRAGISSAGRRARPAGLLRAAHDGRGDGAQLPGLRRPAARRALRHRDRRRGLGGRLPLPREPGAEAPAVRLPDRLRRLPADGDGQRARGLSSAPTATPTRSSTSRAIPWIRDARSSSAIREDVPELPVRPRPAEHPRLDRRATSPSPATRCRSIRSRSPTPSAARTARLPRATRSSSIAAVGGTAVGAPLLRPHRRGVPAR